MIWNDGVAPEQALDFDVPHISSQQAVAMWLGGFGFFFGLYQLVKTLDHPSNKPSVSIRPGPRAPAVARPAPSPPPLPCRSHPRNRAPSHARQDKRELVKEDISRALGGHLKPAEHRYSEL